MRRVPDLGPSLNFLRLLKGVTHRIQARSNRMQRTQGVTSPQRLAVRILGRYQGIGTGELARLMGVKPSTVSGILHRLAAGRYIERRPDPRDSRRTRLYLTRRGRSVEGLRSGTVEATLESALAGQDPKLLASAERVLADLLSRLSTKKVFWMLTSTAPWYISELERG